MHRTKVLKIKGAIRPICCVCSAAFITLMCIGSVSCQKDAVPPEEVPPRTQAPQRAVSHPGGAEQESPTVGSAIPGPVRTQATAATPSVVTPTPTPEATPYPCPGCYGEYNSCMPTQAGTTHHENFLHWTPGHSQLLFYHDESLWTVDSESTEVRRLVDANPGRSHGVSELGFHADLSHDDSLIIFSTCQYLMEARDGSESDNPTYEIATIGLDGTEEQRLTANRFFDHYPVWSPDGGQVAFIATIATGGSRYWGIYDRLSTRLFVLDVPDEGLADAFALSDQQLANANENQSLLRLPGQVSKGRQQVLPYPPVWSPDGQRLAFLAQEPGVSNYVLYTVKPDGSDLARVDEASLIPTWSPNGDRLAFVKIIYRPVSRSGLTEATIYTSKYDGSDLRQLWTSESDERFHSYDIQSYLGDLISSIAWSPDGSEILAASPWLWAVQSDGSGTRPIGPYASPVLFNNAIWSHDGSRITTSFSWAVSRNDWTFGIMTLASDGSDLQVLVGSDAEGRLMPWNTPRVDAVPADYAEVDACSQGVVVPEPNVNQGLVQDCEVLMEVRDQMTRTGSLNWSPDIPIAEWEGVSIAGSPPRVHAVALRGPRVIGILPPELGELEELRALNVGGDDDSVTSGLTGPIPAELGNLQSLRYLNLGFNFLSGEIPQELGRSQSLDVLELYANFVGGCVPSQLEAALSQADRLEPCPDVEGNG